MGKYLNSDGLSHIIGKIKELFQSVEDELDGKQDSLVSGTNIKTVNGGSLLGGGDLATPKPLYGTCSTSASTAAKDVTCADMPETPYAGLTIAVKFSAGNTANALTLKFNGSSASYAVWVDNAATSASNSLLWAANATISFTFDGTRFVVADQPAIYYATCSTAAGTSEKAASVTASVVRKGTAVTVQFTYAHSSSGAALLYITGTSSATRKVYLNGSTVTSGNSWQDGGTVAMVFDGQYWRIVDGSNYKLASGKADASHSHGASDITSGTLAIGRIPTGTTSSTVSLGNHTHSGYAPTSHTHDFADVNSIGTDDVIPTVIRSSWSTSSSTSTLPVTPCFVYSTGDGGLYYCS